MNPKGNHNMTQETLVFFYDKKTAGTRVLLEAAQPAAIPILSALVTRLVADIRCRSVCVLANNVAADALRNTIDEQKLPLVEIDKKPGIIEDIPGPFDAALGILGTANSPSQLVLFSAKSVFGCKKLYFVASGPSAPVLLVSTRGNRDPIDKIFVDDPVAAELHQADMPWVPAADIVPVGTALLDAICRADAATLRRLGRKKLGLADDDRVLLYTNFPGDGHPSRSAKTLEETLAGVATAGMPFAVIVRPHPRMTPQELAACDSICDNSAVQVVKDPLRASYEESIYAADAVACPAGSTYTVLAPYYGRTALVFAYAGEGMSGDIFRAVFPPSKAAALERIRGITVVHDSTAVARALKEARPFEPQKPVQGDSTQTILGYLLS